jgi:hypothetical protein
MEKYAAKKVEPMKVGVEESIVNAPLVNLQCKNTNNAKSEVKFKQLIRDL